MHKFDEAANSFTSFVNLLPNKDRSMKADWSRAEISFLRSFRTGAVRDGAGHGGRDLHRRLRWSTTR
jgi:hypothetical protein